MTISRIVLIGLFFLCVGLWFGCDSSTDEASDVKTPTTPKGQEPTTMKKDEPQPVWMPLQITSAVSRAGATLTILEDGSIIAAGPNADKDVYTVTATTKLTGITAVQIEVIPDEAFGGGAGRGRVNNLVLTEFSLKAAPADGKADAAAVPFTAAAADFSQEGWPVAAAIDGKAETGWAIDPQEATPHGAIFSTAKPVGFDGGTVLTFTLEQGFQAHNIGRFRLWATTTSPVPPPCTTAEMAAGLAPEPVMTASGKKETWTLSTADTALTVGVDSTDQLVIYSLANIDAGWNWTAQPSVIALPKQVTAGDKVIKPAAWRFNKADAAADTLTLTFDCVQLPGLSLESVWWSASPKLPGPLQHTFRVCNKTDSVVRLSKPYLGVIVQPNSGRKALLWTFGDQAGPTRKQGLTDGSRMKIVSRDGKFGQPMPFCVIDDAGQGGLYLGMENQADFKITVDTFGTDMVRADAQYMAGRGMDVPAGETAAASPTYLGVYNGDIDDGCNQFKRWFWNNKTPANHRSDPIAPWAIFGGLWSYETAGSKAAGAVWWSDEATYRKGVEKEGLKDMGFEAVEVDAYWAEAAKAGDWPSGTKIIPQLAHENGLKLNLYLMNHVTWDTREYLKEIWNEYAPDMWRNDFQDTDLNIQAWAQENCSKNYRFNLSCSSCDFRTMTYASITDLYDDNPDVTRKLFYNLSRVLPPAQINILIHLPYTVWDKGAPSWKWDKDRFVRHFRSTLLAGSWTAVAAITPEYNLPKIVLPSDLPEMIPHLKSNLAIYKSEIRPLIRDGNLYHDIVDAASGFDGVQYCSPQKDRGVVMLFGPAGGSTTVMFKRLKPEQKYQVKFTDMPEQNTTLTGAQLMKEGLPVTFTGTAQSEIILIGE